MYKRIQQMDAGKCRNICKIKTKKSNIIANFGTESERKASRY